MSKLKHFIHKLKASLYGTVGRIQFPDQLTESSPTEEVQSPELVADEPPKVVDEEVSSKKTTTKKAPAKKAAGTSAKKPGRPKGSTSAPKE